MVAGGRVWLLGGGGHAWLLGRSVVAGGHAWFLGEACVGYDEIRSMSGRYASYWNAFLFMRIFFNFSQNFLSTARLKLTSHRQP